MRTTYISENIKTLYSLVWPMHRHYEAKNRGLARFRGDVDQR